MPEQVFPSCPVMVHLTNRDERRFLLRCLKHQASLQVHMRAKQLLLPAHACRELAATAGSAGAVDNPFEETVVGEGLEKYIDYVS